MENPVGKWTDKLEGKWETIFVSLCELIVGILLLVRPLKFTAGIIVAAGIFCVLLGLKYGIAYFRMDIIKASAHRDLFKSLIFMGGGAFLIFGSGWLSATQAVLNIVYGVALLTLSAEKIQWSITLLRWQKPYWYVTGMNAVLTVAMAILMLLNPFPKQIIWIVIGIVLAAEAVLDIVALFFARKKTKVHKAGKERVKKEKKNKKEKKEIKTEELHEDEIKTEESTEAVSETSVKTSEIVLESISAEDTQSEEKAPESLEAVNDIQND